jgi:hypothetical protein
VTVNISQPPTVVISTDGTQGPRGNTMLSGDGAPAPTVGIDGDYYTDVANYPATVTLYGPKTAGAWPAQGVVIGGGGSVGALLAVNNLADVDDAGVSRSNLGLGDAAILDVGDTTNTVAAGDDSRFGLLLGTIPVTGTPAAGKAPILTGPTAAAWTTVGGGGGGGATITTADLLIDKEIITLPASPGSYRIMTTSPATGSFPIACSIPAAVGDRVRWSLSWMRTGGVLFYDVALLNSAGGFSRFTSTHSPTPAVEGYPPYYNQEPSFPGIAGDQQFAIQDNEIDGNGMVTFALAYQGATDGQQRAYFGGGYPGYWLLTNLGPEPA